jgi:ABC-type oligopeptide transport system substrate-binding subunit
MKIFVLSLMALLCTLHIVYAAEDKSGLNVGLAMVGEPKMPPGFTHLDYANPNASQGGTLHQSATGTFDTLNPFSLKGKSAQGLNLSYDRLMGRSWDEPFTLYPLIAERAEVPDDRSSLTVFINPAAKFQDGSPITADDVIFSFNTLKEKGRPNMRQVYKLVSKVEKTGPNGVKFTLGPIYDRETVMILAMMPVLSKAYWTGKDFDRTTLKPPVSSGPYKIVSVEPGRRIVYERDRAYWANDLPINKGLYNFDRISYDYYRDETVAFESFKSGNVDIRMEFDPGRWTTAYDFPAIKTGQVRKEAIPHGRVEKMWGFIFNMRRAPFNDIRVRKALSLMIDYDWINQNIFHGQYKPLTSFYANSSLAASGLPSPAELALLDPFRTQLPPEVFGPAWAPAASGTPAANRANHKQADALLKKAGWVVRNGKRVNAKTGKPLTFEIILQTSDDEKVALSFRRSLARLGIDVALRTLDTAAFRDRLNTFEYDMTLYFWLNTLSPGTEQMIYWGCEAAKQEGRFNFSGICTPATDSLAKAIPSVRTREDLIAHTRALDRVLTWSHIAIPLFYSGQDLIAAKKGFQHPKTTALYGNVMENWWFGPPEAPGKTSLSK